MKGILCKSVSNAGKRLQIRTLIWFYTKVLAELDLSHCSWPRDTKSS